MSEQARIITALHTIIMEILKSGSVSEEEGAKIDALEELLQEQACFKKIENSEYNCQGEEIASLFFTDKTSQGVARMIELSITPSDFFGFTDYHYDEEHPDEDLAEMFTGSFIQTVNASYKEQI